MNQITQHTPGPTLLMTAQWLALNMTNWQLDLAVLGLRLLNVLLITTLPPLI